jgi:hypothetical protein
MKKKFTSQEHTGAGLAFILILLIIGLSSHGELWFSIAVITVVLLMLKPAIFYPFTVFWLNGSKALGTVMSGIVLSVIFFTVVVPVAIIRRMAGKDSLNLKQFKQSDVSVLIARTHSFNGNDFIHPY